MRVSGLSGLSGLFGGFIVLAALGSACTFFSGVEELELRKGPAPDASSSTTDTTDPTLLDASAFDPFSLLGKDSGGGGGGKTTGKPAVSGLLVCGATGTWTACEIADTVTSCALRCQAQGFTCVESCCAYDNLGDYVAKVGMVYATAGVGGTCDLSSVPSTSSAGLCSDPILPIGAMDVRCCCR